MYFWITPIVKQMINSCELFLPSQTPFWVCFLTSVNDNVLYIFPFLGEMHKDFSKFTKEVNERVEKQKKLQEMVRNQVSENLLLLDELKKKLK